MSKVAGFFGLAVCIAPAAFAAPTVAELHETCTQALAAGYAGERAAMCDWYVAPCGVCGKDGPPPRAWCVPDGTSAATLAAQVVEDLAEMDPARAAPAAVEEILRRRYPCAAEE
ncbi:MAG TPA: Rap1a/Tai family immunity protein [Gammaproteobacteria bacterium]|nr:Rap1a/Tai family immunity protein [Gammaproteobacteria bacterium]